MSARFTMDQFNDVVIAVYKQNDTARALGSEYDEVICALRMHLDAIPSPDEVVRKRWSDREYGMATERQAMISRQQKWQQKQVAKGLCSICLSVLFSKAYCKTHHEDHRRRSRERYHRKKKEAANV